MRLVIEQVHAAAAIGVVVFAFAVAGLAAIGALARGSASNPGRVGLDRRTVDRAILAVLGLVALGILTGLAQLAGGRAPSDPLHFLYAAVALLILPAARFAGSGWCGHNRGLVVSVAGLILVGIVVRLAQTG